MLSPGADGKIIQIWIIALIPILFLNGKQGGKIKIDLIKTNKSPLFNCVPPAEEIKGGNVTSRLVLGKMEGDKVKGN